MSNKRKKFNYLQAPKCIHCAYFKVSWDVNYPRLCTQFGFKGKEFPSKTVFETTGRHCPMFLDKTHKKGSR